MWLHFRKFFSSNREGSASMDKLGSYSKAKQISNQFWSFKESLISFAYSIVRGSRVIRKID